MESPSVITEDIEAPSEREALLHDKIRRLKLENERKDVLASSLYAFMVLLCTHITDRYRLSGLRFLEKMDSSPNESREQKCEELGRLIERQRRFITALTEQNHADPIFEKYFATIFHFKEHELKKPVSEIYQESFKTFSDVQEIEMRLLEQIKIFQRRNQDENAKAKGAISWWEKYTQCLDQYFPKNEVERDASLIGKEDKPYLTACVQIRAFIESLPE